MTIDAPAKINLTLEVLARREDGYHGIRTVMVPLEFADTLSIRPADRFAFECSDPLLSDDGNLAVRAAHAAVAEPRAAVHLEKRIPVQAGLGGGSSDAASIFLIAMRGELGATRVADWIPAARELGSDVPFFLAESSALVEGTGERVTPLGASPDWHVLLVKPPASVSTASAYRELDRQARPSRARSASVSLAMVEALQRSDFDTVTSLLSNDFEAVVAAMTPPVEVALRALRAAGAERPLLCGSGSAVFALAPSLSALQAIAARLDLPAEYLSWHTRFRETPAWRA